MYVYTFVYDSNKINKYSDITPRNVNFAANELFIKIINCLNWMAEFSYTHINIRSVLSNYFSVKVYGSRLWCFNDHRSIN